MQITVSASRYENALIAHITARIAKDSQDIVAGVPVEVYKERCAYVRALRELLQELPKIMAKARD